MSSEMYQVIDRHANSILLFITVPPPPRRIPLSTRKATPPPKKSSSHSVQQQNVDNQSNDCNVNKGTMINHFLPYPSLWLLAPPTWIESPFSPIHVVSFTIVRAFLRVALISTTRESSLYSATPICATPHFFVIFLGSKPKVTESAVDKATDYGK